MNSHKRTIDKAVEEFNNLSIDDGDKDGLVKKSDHFFEEYGAGNTLEGKAADCSMKYDNYQKLLKNLYNANPEKYKLIHKGTPFYFLSWLALDQNMTSEAIFYADAALSEDKKNSSTWKTAPIVELFLLKHKKSSGARSVEAIRKTMEVQIDRFNKKYVQIQDEPAQIGEITETLLEISCPNNSIFTAFYTFLLESEKRLLELELRGDSGATLENVLLHLFKGCLTFESLLKFYYPYKKRGERAKTLGDILNSKAFMEDFSITDLKIGASDLSEIVVEAKQKDNISFKKAFQITSKLRNTTGHNLVWEDCFIDAENYKILFECIIDTLVFMLIRKSRDIKTKDHKQKIQDTLNQFKTHLNLHFVFVAEKDFGKEKQRINPMGSPFFPVLLEKIDDTEFKIFINEIFTRSECVSIAQALSLECASDAYQDILISDWSYLKYCLLKKISEVLDKNLIKVDWTLYSL